MPRSGRSDPASYRLPAGNLLNRLLGILLVAPFLHPIADISRAVQPHMAKMTAEFSKAFWRTDFQQLRSRNRPGQLS